MAKHREEVINVYVGIALHKRGLASESEEILKADKKQNLIDVLVSMRGMRVAIEGKYEDVPDARSKVLGQAMKRVLSGVAQMAVGVIYPKELRTTSMHSLEAELEECQIEFIVHSEAGTGPWRTGKFAELSEELQRAYETLVKDDVVTRALDRLESGMQGMTAAFLLNEGVSTRLADLLRLYEADNEASADE